LGGDFVVVRAAGAGSGITVFSLWNCHFSSLFFFIFSLQTAYYNNAHGNYAAGF
jgi:hypothetical protein